MYCTILYLFMLSLHIGRVAKTHWVNSGMQKLQLPSLPAQGGSHSAFLHLGSMAISNFRLDRCDQFRSVTSGFTAPWFLTALRKIDWETAWKHQENCSEIKHDWTCRFQLLERDDQYDWKLWLHWCLGWKLLHDCTMCYNQPATSKPQCIWTCTDPFIIHQFGLPACFLPDWFAARNDQTWKLFEVFHCKLRFSEHYGEFVLGGRSLLVFAGNRCEWMASAQNDCSAYSCSRFLSTWTPVSKVAAATGNILSGSEYNYVSCLIWSNSIVDVEKLCCIVSLSVHALM